MLLDAMAALAATPACAGCGVKGARLCSRCKADLTPGGSPEIPNVDRSLAALAYESAARALVLALKLGRDRSAAVPLVNAMRDLVMRRGLRAEVLTWVPGRPADIRARGYDHAAVLAAGAAEALGLVCLPLLVRTSSPFDQTTLNARQRWANLQGAFAVPSSPARVALIDDVVTTGATVGVCAAALRQGGAEGVEALVACRAL